MVRKDGKTNGKVKKTGLKNKLFREEYLSNGFNGTRAIMLVYGVTNEASAAVMASKKLRKVKVMRAIDKRITATFNKMKLNTDMLIAAYINEAYIDTRPFFDENHVFVGMQKLNVAQQLCIESVDTEELYSGKGKDRVHIGTSQRVKFYSRQKAKEMLSKYAGLVKDGNTNTFIFNDNRKIDTKIIAAKELKEILGADRTTELNKFLTTEAKAKEA